jgi:PAS domain S-box-containing protein
MVCASSYESVTPAWCKRDKGIYGIALAGALGAWGLDAVAHYFFVRRARTFWEVFVMDLTVAELVGRSMHAGILLVAGVVLARVLKVHRSGLQRQGRTQSERRFRDLAELLPQTVFEADMDGTVTYINKNGMQAFGYDEKDLQHGVTIMDALQGVERDQVLRRLQAFRRRGVDDQAQGAEYTAVRKDGTRFPALIYANVIVHGKTGNPAGVRGTVVDISNLKQAWERVSKSEHRLREIFDNAPIGIFRTTMQGSPVEINKEMARMLGCVTTEEAMMHFSDLSASLYVNPQRRDEFVRLLLKEGRVSDFEYQARPAGGKESVWIAMNARIAKDSQGREIIDGFARDVTVKKQALEEKRRVRDRMRQAERMEAVGKLAGGIAHDFNNVLGGMLGYTDMTLDDVEKGSLAEKNLRKVLAAGERAKNLIARILTFSRNNDTVRRPMYLLPIVSEALEMLRAAIPSNIKIETSLDRERYPVKVNPKQLHEVLVNLCTNAVDAIESQGVIRVTLVETVISSEAKGHVPPGSYAVLAVQDNGCGMDPEVQQHIFEPFYTLKGPDQGSGMGLSVVHGIIKQHEGYMFVQSKKGAGSTFSVYLPTRGKESEKTDLPVTHVAHRGEHVLFVDDEQMVTDMYAAMFQKLGYRVTALTDPEQALQVFANAPESFDIVISDQTMPKMTGMELSKEILAVRPDVPVIICTGYNEFAYKHTTSTKGIRAICIKPMRRTEFSKIVRNILNTAKEYV